MILIFAALLDRTQREALFNKILVFRSHVKAYVVDYGEPQASTSLKWNVHWCEEIIRWARMLRFARTLYPVDDNVKSPTMLRCIPLEKQWGESLRLYCAASKLFQRPHDSTRIKKFLFENRLTALSHVSIVPGRTFDGRDSGWCDGKITSRSVRPTTLVRSRRYQNDLSTESKVLI